MTTHPCPRCGVARWVIYNPLREVVTCYRCGADWTMQELYAAAEVRKARRPAKPAPPGARRVKLEP
jgi:hypothetical protein